MYGGMAAEEIVFGEATTGPSDDISKATSICRQMVTQWGMSERLGPRTFGRKEEMIFLGREISDQRNYSDKIAEEIDEEVRQIVDKAYQTARKLLTEHRDKLDTIVKALLEEETIEGEVLASVLSGAGLPERPNATGEPPAEEPTTEPKKPVTPPQPGLAWDTPSREEPDVS
jgi:cell division protease FtsH